MVEQSALGTTAEAPLTRRQRCTSATCIHYAALYQVNLHELRRLDSLTASFNDSLHITNNIETLFGKIDLHRPKSGFRL